MNKICRHNKVLLLIIWALLFSMRLVAQKHTYTINGLFSEAISGKVYLVPAISDEKYYGEDYKIDSGKVYKGQFKINRIVNENGIFPYILIVRGNSLEGATNMIFLSQEDQEIFVDSIDTYKSPSVKGSPVQKEMKEYYDIYFIRLVHDIKKFNAFSNQMENKYKGNLPKEITNQINYETADLKNRSDSLFWKYAESHKNSVVTLWKLIERFKQNGYKNLYSSMFNLLDTAIRHSDVAKTFYHELEAAVFTAEGNVFPVLKLQNLRGRELDLDLSQLETKRRYTFVDFWFSSCIPCLVQFPLLKTVYKEYSHEGFKIVGISVDKKAEVDKWKAIVKEKGLPWDNYNDVNGINSGKLSINYFPSNFLLNSRGEIIKRNISIAELEKFLALNLKIADNIQILREPD